MCHRSSLRPDHTRVGEGVHAFARASAAIGHGPQGADENRNVAYLSRAPLATTSGQLRPAVAALPSGSSASFAAIRRAHLLAALRMQCSGRTTGRTHSEWGLMRRET